MAQQKIHLVFISEKHTETDLHLHAKHALKSNQRHIREQRWGWYTTYTAIKNAHLKQEATLYQNTRKTS